MGFNIVSLVVALISLNSVFAQTPTGACVACVSNSDYYFDTAKNTCNYTGNLLGIPKRNVKCDITLANILFSSTAVCDAFNCPRDPPSTFAYNEHNAKNVYWRLQGALKLDPSSATFTQCTQNAASDIIFVNRISVSCGVPLPVDTCITDVYVIPSLSQILTISRGSNGISQVGQMALTLTAPLFSFTPNGTVVKYFEDAADKTWAGGLGAELESLLTNAIYSDYKFVAAGHSLGGPQAILFAARIGQNKWRTTDKIEVYTTGQPRLGNLKYMKFISEYAPQIYRIVNNVDLIPIAPLRTLSNVQHTDWVIRYTPSMTGAPTDPRIQCTWPEQPECMGYNVLESLSESNHNTYFGQDVTSFYETGCVY